MMEIERNSAKVEQIVIGNKNAIHGYVSKTDGEVTRVSVYMGQKQVVTGNNVANLVVLRDVINQMLAETI